VRNPHFYRSQPKLENGAYDQKIVIDLVEPPPKELYVLTNNEHRVYLKFGGTQRALAHVSKTNDNTLIFKGLYPLFPFLP
jgi:hypothetical protein